MTAFDGRREERFRCLFAAAYDDVLRFAQRRVHPTHAEDVVAEAFLTAWRRLDDAPHDSGDQRAWLFGIARNCLLNEQRGQGRRQALAVRLADSLSVKRTQPDDIAEVTAERLAVTSAWQKLSHSEQETLALTVFEDLTSPQAGQGAWDQLSRVPAPVDARPSPAAKPDASVRGPPWHPPRR